MQPLTQRVRNLARDLLGRIHPEIPQAAYGGC